MNNWFILWVGFWQLVGGVVYFVSRQWRHGCIWLCYALASVCLFLIAMEGGE